MTKIEIFIYLVSFNLWISLYFAVEINAYDIALKWLDYSHIFTSKLLEHSKAMLLEQALTYVASIITSLIQIVRLVLLFGRKED